MKQKTPAAKTKKVLKPAKEKPIDAEQTTTLSPEEQTAILDESLERMDKLAESQLEMARLFIARGKSEIARRRLEEILELYGKSDLAKEARKLLKSL